MLASHYNDSALIVAAAILAVTIGMTLAQLFRNHENDEAHKTHLRSAVAWMAGAFVSVLVLVLAIVDNSRPAPSWVNVTAAVVAGIAAGFVFLYLMASQWPPSGRRAKFYVFGMLTVVWAIITLSANFYIYAVDGTNPVRTMLADGALGAMLALAAFFGLLAVFFWFGSNPKTKIEESHLGGGTVR
jgi:MFS family permease